MEEPIPKPNNITVPFSKKTLALAIILIVAVLALVLILSAARFNSVRVVFSGRPT